MHMKTSFRPRHFTSYPQIRLEFLDSIIYGNDFTLKLSKSIVYGHKFTLEFQKGGFRRMISPWNSQNLGSLGILGFNNLWERFRFSKSIVYGQDFALKFWKGGFTCMIFPQNSQNWGSIGMIFLSIIPPPNSVSIIQIKVV